MTVQKQVRRFLRLDFVLFLGHYIIIVSSTIMSSFIFCTPDPLPICKKQVNFNLEVVCIAEVIMSYAGKHSDS